MDDAQLKWLSFAISLLAYVPLGWAAWRGTAAPAKSAFIILSVVNVVMVVGTLASGSFQPQFAAFMVGAFSILAIAYLRNGPYRWGPVDFASLALAGVGIIAWIASGSEDAAIIAGLLASGAGAIPLVADAWKNPHNQVLLPWFLWAVGGALMCATIPPHAEWTVANAATPVVVFVLQAITVATIFFRKTLPDIVHFVDVKSD